MKQLPLACQRGQALVEFAVIVPLLFVLTFGLIEFGFMFNDHAAVVTAARDAARVASLQCSEEPSPPSTAGADCATAWVNSAVTDSTNHLLNCSNVAAVVQPKAPTSAGATNLWAYWTVTVTCTYNQLTPWGALFKPSGGAISGTATMRDGACNPQNNCTTWP